LSFVGTARTYGARCVWRVALAEGFSCGLHKVERLMRMNALRARLRRRGLPKDRGPRSPAVTPNLLGRQFVAERPNQRSIADFTYIWTAEGRLDVAAVIAPSREELSAGR
jgi:putative transposase